MASLVHGSPGRTERLSRSPSMSKSAYAKKSIARIVGWAAHAATERIDATNRETRVLVVVRSVKNPPCSDLLTWNIRCWSGSGMRSKSARRNRSSYSVTCRSILRPHSGFSRQRARRAAGAGPDAGRAARDPLRAQARHLTEHRGDRVERPVRRVPQPADGRPSNYERAHAGVGRGSEQSGRYGRLAVPRSRCSDQVEELMSETLTRTVH